MKRIKIKMIANACICDDYFAKGKEYMVDPHLYSQMSKSCIMVETENDTPTKQGERVWQEFYRILVVSSHGIGNQINKSPLIIKLHEIYKQARIDLLCAHRVKDVFKGWDLINKIYVYGSGIGSDLIENKYDLIVNAIPSGLNINVLGLGGHHVVTGATKWLKDIHEIECNLRILEENQIAVDDIPDTYIPVEKVDFPVGKYVGICAGYMGDKFSIKNWGYKKFGELAELLKEKYKGYTILILGTGKDANVFKYIKSKSIINCIDKYTIQETAYLLTKCDFLVSNDTGLAHVASAVGCKTYTIFGPSNPTKNHPWKNSNVISLDLDCQPCQYTNKWTTCRKLDCLKISPDEVMKQITNTERKINKTKLGIVMSTYDRYEMLYATLNSLYNMIDFKNVKLCICNDGSTDRDINDVLAEFQERREINLEVIQHKKNYGKARYSKTLKELVEGVSDCKYVLFMPDDIIINPYLLKVIEKSYKYLKGDIKVLNFMIDSRAVKSPHGKQIYYDIAEYDEWFTRVIWTDGFLALMKYETIAGLRFENKATVEGSNTWPIINKQLVDYKQLRLKESLCLHIGNVCSIMNSAERKYAPIRSIKVNINNKPKILG